MNQLQYEEIIRTRPGIGRNHKRALRLCRGAFQRSVILHGADIRSLAGAAKKYSGKYLASVQALSDRLTAAGIPWGWTYGPRGGFLGGIRIVEVES